MELSTDPLDNRKDHPGR